MFINVLDCKARVPQEPQVTLRCGLSDTCYSELGWRNRSGLSTEIEDCRRRYMQKPHSALLSCSLQL